MDHGDRVVFVSGGGIAFTAYFDFIFARVGPVSNRGAGSNGGGGAGAPDASPKSSQVAAYAAGCQDSNQR